MEPEQLRRGKEFHKRVQAEWTPDKAEGTPRCEKRIIVGRVDVLVEDLGDMVSVVEIKSTDWDKIRPDRVVRLLGAHRRQVWKYIDEFLDRHSLDVCPGIIYPSPPRRLGMRKKIEDYMSEWGLPVVWFDET